MRKQELIHLHGLLAEASNQYENWTDDTVEFDEYESIGVKPSAIHRSKSAHEEAIAALSTEFVESMDGESDGRTVAATAD
ncbi:metal-binding protein [Halobacteriales archaeon SW_7_68_16]|nr:MAG: metal-binding protein [Halobacteriales archaeon SW_7_68_16]